MCFETIGIIMSNMIAAATPIASTTTTAAGATVPLISAGEAAAITAVGVGAAGYGMMAAGQAQEVAAANSAAEYNAAILEQNAKIARMEAAEASRIGKLEEQELRQKVRRLKSAQRAGYAASGVVVDVGSPLAVAAETAEYGEQDAMTIRRNTAMSIWGKETEAAGYFNQANLSRKKKRSPSLDVGATLLSGTSRLMNQYYGRG